MKILVIGDIHGKTIWKEIVGSEQPDLTIFLGDYVTTHHKETPEEQINNLMDILTWKEDEPDKVILLRGNNDMQMLGYHWAKCSGYNMELGKLMEPIKTQFLNSTQWIFPYEIGKKFYVFSHAGISKTWYENVKRSTKIECMKDINNLEPSELFGFTPNDFNDYSGTSITQPCTWIRPQALIEDMPDNINQVVGHTPIINRCFNVSEKMFSKYGIIAPELWLCDALDNQSYLVINGKRLYSKILGGKEKIKKN